MLAQHLAFTIPFDELYAGLQQEVANGNVDCVKHPTEDLELYNYSIQCTMSKAWNTFTLVSRGLIICPSMKLIVASPFAKFFNYGEAGELVLPNLPFTALEKVDGSMATIYYWNGQWRVATRGSFFSDQAVWAEKYLNTKLDNNCLVPGDTYIAEIIYPENRIVISYDFEGLILLSIFNSEGFEIGADRKLNEFYAKHVGFRLPKQYSYNTVDEMLAVCKTLSSQKEGFVVRFSNGYRIKIKGDEYCRVHAIISNCKPLAIWESLMNNDNLVAVRAELPEEMHRDFDTMIEIFRNKEDSILLKIERAFTETKSMTDKELGLSNVEMKNFIFACRKHDFLNRCKIAGSSQRRALYDLFRPKANILEGYVPSNAMNRFSKADAEN